MAKDINYFDLIKKKFWNSRTHEPRRVVKCDECGKKSLRLVGEDTSFISGTGCYYECSCGNTERHIL
jgi:hypothetical protein